MEILILLLWKKEGMQKFYFLFFLLTFKYCMICVNIYLFLLKADWKSNFFICLFILFKICKSKPFRPWVLPREILQEPKVNWAKLFRLRKEGKRRIKTQQAYSEKSNFYCIAFFDICMKVWGQISGSLKVWGQTSETAEKSQHLKFKVGIILKTISLHTRQGAMRIFGTW